MEEILKMLGLDLNTLKKLIKEIESESLVKQESTFTKEDSKIKIMSFEDILKEIANKPIEKEQQTIHKIKIEPKKSLQGLNGYTYEGNEEEIGNYTIQFNNNCIYLKTKDGKYTLSLTDKQIENVYKIVTNLDSEYSIDEYLKALMFKEYWGIQADNKDDECDSLLIELDKINKQINSLKSRREELVARHKKTNQDAITYEENKINYEADIEDIELNIE